MNVKRKLPELAEHEQADLSEPECLIIPSEHISQEDTILVPIGSIQGHIIYITTDHTHMDEIDNLEGLKELKECLGA